MRLLTVSRTMHRMAINHEVIYRNTLTFFDKAFILLNNMETLKRNFLSGMETFAFLRYNCSIV